MLDLVPEGAFGDARVLMLRSAPGAGKTSLLRVFTPSALQTLRANAAREDFKDLYERVRALGAVTEDRVLILGVRLSCAQTYSSLDDAGPATIADRLLFGLVNARVILATLRDVSAATRLPLSTVLDQIVFNANDATLPIELQGSRSGAELFDWARALESRICGALDSFAPDTAFSTSVGQDSLYALQVLGSGAMHMDGVKIPERVAVMFDDVHLLTKRQRQRLIDEAVRIRARTPVWIAERYEAMSPVDLLSLGAAEGRDVQTVYVEEYWRSRPRRFEAFVKNVADRRAASAVDADVPAFDACLEPAIDPDRWESKLRTGLRVIRERVLSLTGSNGLYSEWVMQRENSQLSLFDRVVEWRALEILIEREKRREQLDIGLPYSVTELARKDDADVHRAAELFVASELGLPLYYGPGALAVLASSNVDQYLALAGDLFEEALSAALLHRPTLLSPERQDSIVRAAALTRWSDIPARVAGGRRVREFLSVAGQFARQQTFRVTAPYSPGITGFAYAMDEHERLLDKFPDLAKAIAAAIADNLLEARPDYSCKGRLWMVLFFNRLLCAHFGLPLGYGGFKEQRLSELHQWYTHGVRGIPKLSEELQ